MRSYLALNKKPRFKAEHRSTNLRTSPYKQNFKRNFLPNWDWGCDNTPEHPAVAKPLQSTAQMSETIFTKGLTVLHQTSHLVRLANKILTMGRDNTTRYHTIPCDRATGLVDYSTA